MLKTPANMSTRQAALWADFMKDHSGLLAKVDANPSRRVNGYFNQKGALEIVVVLNSNAPQSNQEA